jgi:hypothetical protein
MDLFYLLKIVIQHYLFIFIFVVLYHKIHLYQEKILNENYLMLFHQIIDKLLLQFQEKVHHNHLLLDMIFNIIFLHKILLNMEKELNKNIGQKLMKLN